MAMPSLFHLCFFATADKQSCPHTPNLKIKYKISTLQVATILVAMVPKILELATSFVKKSP